MKYRDSDFVCPGFRAAGIPSGIKGGEGGDELDLALIVSDLPTRAVGVFTKNRVKAAPILLSMKRLEAHSPRAVVINSGNANACTGERGMEDAEETTRRIAGALGLSNDEVIPASTGVIGTRLPVEKITGSAKRLVSGLTPDGFVNAARAIMTTDTFPKLARRTISTGKREYTLLGITKGAGMIRPDMATMLAFVVTDMPLKRDFLDDALKEAIAHSFNAITIDGDTSTNDMVLLMSGGDLNEGLAPKGREEFRESLGSLLHELAEYIVRDGEGATKFVKVSVKNAPDESTAKDAAFKVANSPLVKTAFFGQDPNWGRIMGALGCVNGDFDPNVVDISFGDIGLVKSGQLTSHDNEEAIKRLMQKNEFEITIDLKSGKSSFVVMTSDLSFDYIKINAEYRS